MRRLFTTLALVAAVTLGGCATFGNIPKDVLNVWNVATGVSVSPAAVIVAANTFDALEASATNYLRLPKCSAVSGPVCRAPEAARAIIKAIRAGRPARNQLETFLRTHPGELGPQGLYDALTTTAQTVQAIFAQYQIGGIQ